MNTLPKIFIAAVALFSVQACSRYEITQTDGGYDLSLPADLIDTFPGEHEIEVAFDDSELGISTVRGVATLSGSDGLIIRTDDEFRFQPVRGSTFLLLRSIGGQPTAGWSGCSRDPGLRPYKGDDSICWCWSDGGLANRNAFLVSQHSGLSGKLSCHRTSTDDCMWLEGLCDRWDGGMRTNQDGSTTCVMLLVVVE